jgi:hypothetical protein
MTEQKKYDERGREIVEELPHGKYVKYPNDGGTFWEPDNVACFYGEDCPVCSRDKSAKPAATEGK